MADRIVKPTAAHQAFRNDAIALLRKHSKDLDDQDMLALGAHLVGQIIALQDQRKMTPGLAMEIVARNIELGNADVIAPLMRSEGNG